MRRCAERVLLTLLPLALVHVAPRAVWAQARPYIGYAYPAGARQGTTATIKLGGQNLDAVDGVIVSGQGVQGRVVSFQRRLNPQEIRLLRDQLQELRTESKARPVAEGSSEFSTPPPPAVADEAPAARAARIQRRIAEHVQQPASASLATITWIEVTVAADAEPGSRELRLVTPRGVSNPLVFQVGQLPEVVRPPLLTSPLQVLGKEEAALRRLPGDDSPQRVTLPATLNGQIAPGRIDRYRFEAKKGQKLVIAADARLLIPYLADAVPGWFQPVMTLRTAAGREVAYNDDYTFKPDPLLLFEVPADGEYLLSINDALFRGREDFVYRIHIGELPFVTSIFPLGGGPGATPDVKASGWNLGEGRLHAVPNESFDQPGTHWLELMGPGGLVSNRVPYAVDTLPEVLDIKPNDAKPQPVTLPVLINGRIDRPGDRDRFTFEGKAGQDVVCEVLARRLESPLDSRIWIQDSAGTIVAYSDDCEDLGSGVNTHHADSFLRTTLPADDTYTVHLVDTASSGGESYAYRLRVSEPRPDFELRVVPSSLTIRSKQAGALDIHVIRRDGFNAPIRLELIDPPAGFKAPPVTLTPDKPTVRMGIRTLLAGSSEPVRIRIQGTARIGGKSITHEAVPAEDRMQAFLWRHLVPADDLPVVVFNPADDLVRTAFSRKTTAGRLRQLELLRQEGLLTDAFYQSKVEETEKATP